MRFEAGTALEKARPIGASAVTGAEWPEQTEPEQTERERITRAARIEDPTQTIVAIPV